MNNGLKEFYDREYGANRYPSAEAFYEHVFYPELRSFVEQYDLKNKRCLEIGCGRGAFQDVVSDYVGLDITDSVRKYLHKPFCLASAAKLPFKDDAFDAMWTFAVLEHIPGPEAVLSEIRRVLRNGALLLLAPAWQCRSWAAEGYPVRPYHDLDLKGKLVKASIPIRDSILFRSGYVFPRRLIRTAEYRIIHKPMQFKYTKLTPNLDSFWMSDSDAVNSMDPYEAILWFTSRGDECLSYPTWLSRFLVRTGAIVFRIRKP